MAAYVMDTHKSTMLMDNINEHDEAIDRYLNGALTEAERTAFEIRMMQDESLLERVQLVDALKQGLAGTTPPLPATVTVLPFRAWMRQPLSLAASVLVAVLGLQLVTQRASAPAAIALPIGSTVLLEGLRSSGGAVEIEGTGPFLFQIDAGLGQADARYTVALRAADGALVLEQGDLPVDANGWVRFVYSGALTGVHDVELRPQGAASAAARHFSITAD